MFVGNSMYAVARALTKLSIVASYVHIFSPYGKMQYVMYGTAAVTVVLSITSIPVTIFQCRPVSAAWDFTIQGATCYPFVDFLYASTAINIVTDLILCTVPIPFFWRLHLPMKQKVLVSILFFLGGL